MRDDVCRAIAARVEVPKGGQCIVDDPSLCAVRVIGAPAARDDGRK